MLKNFIKKVTKLADPTSLEIILTSATLRHLCAPLIAQRLNLIIIFLNQGSSCENSLSYLVAPRPQNIYM